MAKERCYRLMLATCLIGLSLSACATGSLERAVGIDETDNAIQCIDGSAHTNYIAITANISTKRVELPGWLRTDNLQDGTVEDLVRVFEAIAAITENLNCP